MLSKVLGVAGRLLIVAGLVILGFVAYQLWGTGLEESRQQDELLDEYAQSIGADQDLDLADVVAQPAVSQDDGPPPNPVPGEPAGVIEIPRIELARVIVEGTSRADLKKGPGHYIGTPFPGQAGNVGIAGHRTTYGAPFNRIDTHPGKPVCEVFRHGPTQTCIANNQSFDTTRTQMGFDPPAGGFDLG